MIKFLLPIVCCVATAMTVAQAATYPTKYDSINIDEILSNDRLVLNYFKCFMDTGKCTPEGEEIKRWLPEAIENKCEKCSQKQKLGTEKVIKFLNEKKKDLWKQLLEKYDPQGIYRQRYKGEARKFNFDA